MDTSDLRGEYNGKNNLFLEDDIARKNPFSLFEIWNRKAAIDDPNSVFLATCKEDGQPGGHVVLLNGFAQGNFIFSMHYTSRNEQDFEENPKAALTIYWEHSSRSVRIEGNVEKSPIFDASTSFPIDQSTQLGAFLQQKRSDLVNKYGDGIDEGPAQRDSYLMKPQVIEFWQGQTDRIHDRIRFRYPKAEEPDHVLTKQGENGWIFERLGP